MAVADRQTAGRGRLDRTWEAPAGSSLLVSLLLRPKLLPTHVHSTTMAAAVAASDAFDEVAGFRPLLKWPNDIVVGDRKLGGLLAEADEAFLTSSTRDVQAIASVDGAPLPATPGPLTKAAADAFRDLRERDADP